MTHTYTDITHLTNCPQCNTNWVEKEIPEQYRHNYSAPYFYSRVIGVELSHQDRIDHWLCPDCKTTFPRDY
jgi:rubredoxin